MQWRCEDLYLCFVMSPNRIKKVWNTQDCCTVICHHCCHHLSKVKRGILNLYLTTMTFSQRTRITTRTTTTTATTTIKTCIRQQQQQQQGWQQLFDTATATAIMTCPLVENETKSVDSTMVSFCSTTGIKAKVLPYKVICQNMAQAFSQKLFFGYGRLLCVTLIDTNVVVNDDSKTISMDNDTTTTSTTAATTTTSDNK